VKAHEIIAKLRDDELLQNSLDMMKENGSAYGRDSSRPHHGLSMSSLGVLMKINDQYWQCHAERGEGSLCIWRQLIADLAR